MARYSVLQLADQLLRLLQRGNIKLSRSYDRREIARIMRDVASGLCRDNYYQNKKLGVDQIFATYVAIFDNIDVQKYDDSKICYAELPADPEDLGDNTGIMNVWPVQANKQPRAMIPLPLNADVILSQLPAGWLEGQFGFRPYRDKVEFTNIIKNNQEKNLIDEKITKVKIQMVTMDPADVGDDQPFPISPHLRPTLLLKTLYIFGLPEKTAEQLVNSENANNQ